jgi:hypothetical protein
MKKVAFIGCSHFAAFEPGAGQGTDSWTWQLAQRYPVHKYRNYSIGGRGIEYFQWCLMNAKSWGANVVFLNRTYTGRWAMMGEYDEHANTDFANNWKIEKHSGNWEESYLDVAHSWGSGGNTDVAGHVDPYLEKKLKAALETITETWASTDLRRSYENQWYRQSTTFYNFENIFLVDWAGHSRDHDIISNINTEISVVDMLKKKFDCDFELDLFKYGVTRAADDNHLSQRGHKIVLDEYILACEDVVNALTVLKK